MLFLQNHISTYGELCSAGNNNSSCFTQTPVSYKLLLKKSELEFKILEISVPAQSKDAQIASCQAYLISLPTLYYTLLSRD